MHSELKYCENVFSYRRRQTHEVKVGEVGIGGDNPIRVQSMTIADTMDTSATVAEVRQLVEVGCEIVRITAPSINEAENLRLIRAALRRDTIHVPLVADIHFTPNAAMIAADYVEKVRINPGNYADRKKFEVREYSDREYEEELGRIAEKFLPLVRKCRANGVAMRIGVNHGSLSDRVMNRYGDTPEGMVQSALEFIRLCEAENYRDVVVSMKSSNPQVMIQAYRLLAAGMAQSGMTYPFHLGVTEAGDGEDGRIKSAVGIGALLEDGIGDTIRVSLTEDSVHEVPVAQALVKRYNGHLRSGGYRKAETGSRESGVTSQAPASRIVHPASETRPPDAIPSLLDLASVWNSQVNPYEYRRRRSMRVTVPGLAFGQNEIVRVGIAVNGAHRIGANELRALVARNRNGLAIPGLPSVNDPGAERLDIGDDGAAIDSLKKELHQLGQWLPLAAPSGGNGYRPEIALFDLSSADRSRGLPDLRQALASSQRSGNAMEFLFSASAEMAAQFGSAERLLQAALEEDYWNWSVGIVLQPGQVSEVGAARALVAFFDHRGATMPVTLRYAVPAGEVDWHIDAGSQLGALLCDGVGDAIVVGGAITSASALRFCYNLLQATRLRISKTEFISCPSCGRTLFNLQTTTERIKAKTGHLKGVKIAIMGCIVNGPGEMADADFGYVGAGPGKVNLFVGKDCVERNIPQADADARLIELIKRHNRWVEPEPALEC